MPEMNKRVFKFFNGVKDVWVDPLKIERELMKNIETVDFDSILKKIDGPEFMEYLKNGVPVDKDGNPLDVEESAVKYALKAQQEAISDLASILYPTFGLSPIDPDTGEGTTEEEILDIWYKWTKFRYEVKKNIESELNLPSSILESTSTTETTTNPTL